MEPRYRFRLYLLTAAVLVGFGALLMRLHDFQIVRRDKFLGLVPGDTKVTIREPGTRGEITDRNGITLAKNVRDYEVTFNLAEIDAAYRRQHTDRPELERVTMEHGMLRKRTERDIVGIVMETVIPPLQNLGLAKNFSAKALRAHYLTHHGLVPFTYRADLTYEEFAKFAEHNLELPGVSLSLNSQRQYPYGSLGSHVLGYLKGWEKGDIPEGADRKYDHYIGEAKGIAGVESTMDQYLRGPEGTREMLKDEKGAIRGMVGYVRPGTGAKVELTLDARIQYLAEDTLRHAGRAAAVVMDVETGEVLAMASVPDYDPNEFIPKIDGAKWLAYNKNTAKPLMNRCISNFVPGSTFKLGTALSGALKGQSNRVFSCDGVVQYGNASVGCWIWNKSRGSHGSETLPVAIKNSCNPYFNKLANTIGPKAMTDGFTMLGFGKPTGIDLPSEAGGVVLGNRQWRASHPGATPTPHDVALFSIGQSVLATPLQLCSMVTAIANGGKYYQPRIIKKVVAMDGSTVIPDKPKLEVDLLREGIKDSDLVTIRKGMWMAVNEGGTASAVKLPDIQIGAKTGTAQVNLLLKTHDCWTVAFAPFEKPKYAVVVMVQDGGSGGHTAGPLVQHIIRGIIGKDRGTKLPLAVQKEYGGHMKAIESIAALEDVPPADPNDTAGDDTGDEVMGDDATAPVPVEPEKTIPTPIPTIDPGVDEEGTIPKAIPVR
ncbi:penicillin-binding transpeptidase domain-containing protein [Luteolibacter sp. LG18]|uniref:peptidoglycan D,D-transpeptidase FtsI family protein n=1 Tax=Luteolibacter sp. LG18 TaxID=2819286 RepID=UPI002B302731|nr:peptidoglycan glycosyltransferase [Luteolibacter sp. LG18]